MGTSLIDNFDYRGRRFLDDRQQAATLAALRAIPESTVPDGFRAYCAETGRWYEYGSANTADPATGRWRTADFKDMESAIDGLERRLDSIYSEQTTTDREIEVEADTALSEELGYAESGSVLIVRIESLGCRISTLGCTIGARSIIQEDSKVVYRGGLETHTVVTLRHEVKEGGTLYLFCSGENIKTSGGIRISVCHASQIEDIRYDIGLLSARMTEQETQQATACGDIERIRDDIGPVLSNTALAERSIVLEEGVRLSEELCKVYAGQIVEISIESDTASISTLAITAGKTNGERLYFASLTPGTKAITHLMETTGQLIIWTDGANIKSGGVLDISVDAVGTIEQCERRIDGLGESFLAEGTTVEAVTGVPLRSYLCEVAAGDTIEVTLECDTAEITTLALTVGNDGGERVYFKSMKPGRQTFTHLLQTSGSLSIWTAAANIVAGGDITVAIKRLGPIARMENEIMAMREKATFDLLIPPCIYTVCNDVNPARNYSARVHIDHFLSALSVRPDVRLSNGTTAIPFYSKLNTYQNYVNSNEPQTTKDVDESTLAYGLTNGQTFTISHVSVRNSITKGKGARLLCIGDSVTEGVGASRNLPYAGAPAQYWAWVKALFEMDGIDDSGATYPFAALGNLLGTSGKCATFSIRFGEYEKAGVTACACGVGGSKTTDWLSPVLNNGVINPFYDTVHGRFSLRYWVDNYRTLKVMPDGGVEPCAEAERGSLADSASGNVGVCEPTHVLIQLGYNQVYGERADYIADITRMADTIHEEYPDVYVLLSLPDTPGTYFPHLFPEYVGEGNDIYSTDLMASPAKAFHDRLAGMNADLMRLAAEKERVMYVPTYFTTPACDGGSTRDVPELAYLSNPNSRLRLLVHEGSAPHYHPANASHANWAYQIYSLIKYTLALD